MASEQQSNVNSSESPKQKSAFAGPAGWIVTALAALAIIGTGYYVQQMLSLPDLDPATTNDMDARLMPRTRKLVKQKVDSLFQYNDDRPLDEILDFYKKQSGHKVTLDAFRAMTDRIVSGLIPELWDRAQADSRETMIMHFDMHRWIQLKYPHKTLTNADVIFFPDAKRLRTIVSEPNTDFFRDSGWHWKWIGQFLDNSVEQNHAAGGTLKLMELDVYAAEELSEFLSVLGVVTVQMAAKNLAADPSAVIDAAAIENVFDSFGEWQALENPRDAEVISKPFLYSEQTKKSLLDSLPNPMFVDVTANSGISYTHQPSARNWTIRSRLGIPVGIEGGGLSANDIDGDGDADIYFAGNAGGRLYRNNGKGTFVDDTQSSGIPTEGETRAGYFVDFDNDGDNDLFLTRVGIPNVLLENDGTGKFVDITTRVRLNSGNHVTHEAGWADINNDGLLDVYLCNFGNWLVGEVPTIGRENVNAPPNELFLQRIDENGNRWFKEVAKEMHVDDRSWTHCVGFYDFDRDGWLDLFSLNDFGASFVYRNLEGKDFEEVSGSMKVDSIYNAMNFTLFDVQHDGHLSIYVSEIMKLVHRQRYKRPTEQTKIVFNPKIKNNMRILVKNGLLTMNDEKTFDDEHNQMVEPMELGWAWGMTAFDYENDSDSDMLIFNGTEPELPPFNVEIAKTMPTYVNDRNYMSLFKDEINVSYIREGEYFYDVSAINPIAFKGNSRSAVPIDLDGDGDQDIVVMNYDSAVQVFENRQTENHNWIRFNLVGSQSNRNAIGARVEVRFDGQSRFDQVVAGSGFLSQNPFTLHFGLGGASQVDEVIVHWPSGKKQILNNFNSNQLHQIVERTNE